MDWIKPVKEIFRRFSVDKSPLPIVQVNGQKGETGSPFIVKPAASKDRLPGLIVSHIVHDQEKKYIPAIRNLLSEKWKQQAVPGYREAVSSAYP